MLLSTQHVRSSGLDLVGIDRPKQTTMSRDALQLCFHKHYGSTPLDLAEMWYDLTVTDITGAALTVDEKNMKGFTMFMTAHYFLWTYPKNANLVSSRFGVNDKYVQGKHLWTWIAKIAALRERKIAWDDRLDDPNTELFCISVDGKDFKCWERKHPELPIDPGMMSEKFRKAGWKYEIALSIWEPKVVWLYGPHRGGKHDMTIFRERLKNKMSALAGKLVNADLGYRTSQPDEMGMVAYPNSLDDAALKQFKSRIRCRQETFNGRLTFFKILQDTFRHSEDQHRMAMEAVCVTVQYQMDNGSPIYEV